MHADRRAFVSSAAFAFALVLVGCGGGGTAKVRGKVTHAGKTVVWGTVILVGKDGIYRDGRIGLNGEYEIADVPVGPVKLGVSSPDPGTTPPKGRPNAGGKKPDDPRAKSRAGREKEDGPDLPKPPPGAWFALPKKFADPQSSGLTGEVTGGETTLDIDVK